MLQIILFDTSAKESTLPQNILIADLEVAKINFDGNFDGHRLSNDNSTKIGIISSDSLIAIWDNELTHAELLKTKYLPHLPPHMQVENSWLYLLRIKPKKDLSVIDFVCTVEPKKPLLEEEIETGERLFSKSFSFKEKSISIGTEDEESLFIRSSINDTLPNRYIREKRLDQYSNLIHSSEKSIKILLPPLKKDELAQLHFVIIVGKDPVANWYAADADIKKILKHVGCQ